MVRMSMMRSYPIICNSKRLGILQSICLDDAQKRVSALIVCCGILGKRTVFPESILSLGNGFILVSGHQRYRKIHEQPPCIFVRDSTGMLIGRVTDYAIDETDFKVVAIEMASGYTLRRSAPKFWIYAYACSRPETLELCVPACLGSEQTGMKEED